MNIKLHTPKTLKSGSGMSTAKQLLLSIVATSISIALTFGTAAIVDSNKKANEKREIVMMVMYDMYNSLQSFEQADSMIYHTMNLQLRLAEDTTQFTNIYNELLVSLPFVEYTETTERIFSSNIETINTVGDVFFTENVADFYRLRNHYKTMVCDSLFHHLRIDDFSRVDSALGFNFIEYAIMSGGFVRNMKRLFDQCKQMMDVSTDDMEAYRKERMKMEESISGGNDEWEVKLKELRALQDKIDQAKKK